MFNFALNLMDQAGYAGIFILMVLESATLPVPSEVVLPLAGVLVAQGHLDFWLAVAVASVGSLVGTMIDFAIGYYLGRAVVLRYGRYVRLSEKHLKMSEQWFAKYGSVAVLFARFVPLIRTVVAFPAGIAEMSIPKFLAFSAVGIVAWDAILIYIGDVAGQNSTQIIDELHSIFTYLEIAAVVIAVLAVAFYIRRQRRRASLVSGGKRELDKSP